MVRVELDLQVVRPLEAVTVTPKAVGKPVACLVLTHVMTAAVLFATVGNNTHTHNGRDHVDSKLAA